MNDPQPSIHELRKKAAQATLVRIKAGRQLRLDSGSGIPTLPARKALASAEAAESIAWDEARAAGG